MFDKLICLFHEQVNSLMLSVSSFCFGLVLDPLNRLYTGGTVLEHWITTVLQWIAFMVAIMAGIWTICKGHKKIKK